MTTPATHPTLEVTSGHPIEQVIVPVTLDESYDRGVSAAATLAERFDLPLCLVSVELGSGDVISLDREAKLAQAADAVAAAHPALTLSHEILAATDEPASTFAELLDASRLPVIATRAIEGPGESFAQDTVVRSGAPVLMLGPNAELRSEGDVVVGVDGSALAERILPAARGLAAAIGANVKLVHVVPAAVSAHVTQLRDRGQQVAENAYVQDLCARLDDPTVTWEVVHHDEPAVVLASIAARTRPAALALATHGREGFVARVFGSVAQATVREATCPVLVQRPVGQLDPRELV